MLWIRLAVVRVVLGVLAGAVAGAAPERREAGDRGDDDDLPAARDEVVEGRAVA